jgi:hypothetical protein
LMRIHADRRVRTPSVTSFVCSQTGWARGPARPFGAD